MIPWAVIRFRNCLTPNKTTSTIIYACPWTVWFVEFRRMVNSLAVHHALYHFLRYHLYPRLCLVSRLPKQLRLDNFLRSFSLSHSYRIPYLIRSTSLPVAIIQQYAWALSWARMNSFQIKVVERRTGFCKDRSKSFVVKFGAPPFVAQPIKAAKTPSAFTGGRCFGP